MSTRRVSAALASPPHGGWVPKSYSATLHDTTAMGATNRKKPFVGVSNPSKGSGATIGYLYLGIRAKGLMSVTSPHPKVKDATATSSDSQGPGNVSSNSEDEVSASFDPKAWAPTPPTSGHGLQLVRSHGEGSASSDPRGSDSVSPGPQGEISALPVP